MYLILKIKCVNCSMLKYIFYMPVLNSKCLKIFCICVFQTSILTTLTIHEQIVSVTLNIFMKNIVLSTINAVKCLISHKT